MGERGKKEGREVDEEGEGEGQEEEDGVGVKGRGETLININRYLKRFLTPNMAKAFGYLISFRILPSLPLSFPLHFCMFCLLPSLFLNFSLISQTYHHPRC